MSPSELRHQARELRINALEMEAQGFEPDTIKQVRDAAKAAEKAAARVEQYRKQRS